MSKQCDQREEPEQGRCRAQNRQVRPLALGFDAEMSARLLKGDFQRPAQDKAFHDLWGGDTAVRAEAASAVSWPWLGLCPPGQHFEGKLQPPCRFCCSGRATTRTD